MSNGLIKYSIRVVVVATNKKFIVLDYITGATLLDIRFKQMECKDMKVINDKGDLLVVCGLLQKSHNCYKIMVWSASTGVLLQSILWETTIIKLLVESIETKPILLTYGEADVGFVLMTWDLTKAEGKIKRLKIDHEIKSMHWTWSRSKLSGKNTNAKENFLFVVFHQNIIESYLTLPKLHDIRDTLSFRNEQSHTFWKPLCSEVDLKPIFLFCIENENESSSLKYFNPFDYLEGKEIWTKIDLKATYPDFKWQENNFNVFGSESVDYIVFVQNSKEKSFNSTFTMSKLRFLMYRKLLHLVNFAIGRYLM